MGAKVTAAARLAPGARFTGRTVIVTGAGQGIGRACALRLAQEGASIVGVDLHAAALDAVGEQVRGQGGGWRTVAGDLRSLETFDRSLDVAVADFGGLYGLVNNAAVTGASKRLSETVPADFQQVMDINLKAVWYALQAAYAPIVAGGGGAVVNIASMAAMRPSRRLPIYGASKAGVIGLTQQAALEYAEDGIRVNCVCPGPVNTPAAEAYKSKMPPSRVEELDRRIMRTAAMNRWGEPAEIAAAVCFLLSDDASFITGAILPVDGGSSVR
jgi:NAD(P)-dependent dehydrogenase (short-subunit alcohol dehydrogenase family)